MTRDETLLYLRTKEKEFQKDEKAVHAIWTREEESKRWRGLFDVRPHYDNGDKPENHFKKDES
jgi:hypothetical protein